MRIILSVLLILLVPVGLVVFSPYIGSYINLATAKLWHVDYVVAANEIEALKAPGQNRSLIIPPKAVFWLAIPKLGVISEVDENVNFASVNEQSKSLSRGRLIHSLDSYLPGQLGTVVVSSHSVTSDNWPRTNAPYYFASRLEKGDQIIIGYYKDQFKFQVAQITLVESLPDLSLDTSSQNLILLTGSPFIAGPRFQINAVEAGLPIPD